MKTRQIVICLLVILCSLTLNSCFWARRCPEKTCRVHTEHRHNGGNYRPRAAFSWITTKKHWPWSSLVGGKKYNGKKGKKSEKAKFKYLLPGERVDFDSK